MPDKIGKKSVFERERGWSGLGWSAGQFTSSMNAGPKIRYQLNCAKKNCHRPHGRYYIHQTDPTAGGHTQVTDYFCHVYKLQDKRQCDPHRYLVDSHLREFDCTQRHRNSDSSCNLLTICLNFTVLSDR